jgi:predicted CXXCH cytochrome family protein
VRIAFALAMAAVSLLKAQTGNSFSHRLHLQLKIACTTCHAQASASTSARDNLLPKKEVCQGCHKDVTIPPAPISAVAHFSHAQHLRLGNIAPLLARAIDRKTYLSPPGDERAHLNGTNPCVACHRGLEESDVVTNAAMPRMADCLVCHTQIDPPDSCQLCHPGDMKLKPADHTPDFLDSHNRKSTILDKASCTVCHGRKFTCLGCH